MMFAKRLIALVVVACCTTICQSFVAPNPVVIQAVKIRQESLEASAFILPRVSINPSKRALSSLHLASQLETLKKDNQTNESSRLGAKLKQKGRENALVWKKFWKKVHRLIVVASLAAAMTFSCWLQGANAVSSGRMGGSFGRSSSSSSSSSFGGSYSGRYSSSPYRSRSYSYHNSSPMYSSRPLYYSRGTVAVERRSNPLDFLIFAGFVGFVGFDYWRKSSTDGASTVVSLTLSLEIPDRDNPNNVLAQLEALSRNCDTSTRQGVATLLSNGKAHDKWELFHSLWLDRPNVCFFCESLYAVSLVLARQQDSVFSANLSQQEFNQDDAAEREFNRISVQERTKFETELSESTSFFTLFHPVVAHTFCLTHTHNTLTLTSQQVWQRH